MNQYTNQPTLSFSSGAVVEHIDGINNPERRARAIVGMLQTYSSTRDVARATREPGVHLLPVLVERVAQRLCILGG